MDFDQIFDHIKLLLSPKYSYRAVIKFECGAHWNQTLVFNHRTQSDILMLVKWVKQNRPYFKCEEVSVAAEEIHSRRVKWLFDFCVYADEKFAYFH